MIKISHMALEELFQYKIRNYIVENSEMDKNMDIFDGLNHMISVGKENIKMVSL